MADKKKVYFTCALSGLTEEQRAEMATIRDSLREDFEILEYCDPKQMNPSEIFAYDIDVNVVQADFLVSIVNRGATGLGYEQGTAIEALGKPVLSLAHRDAGISPFVVGNNRPQHRLAYYDDVSEIRQITLEFSKIEFPKPKRVVYIVMTMPSMLERVPSEKLPRFIDSDPVRVLESARSLRPNPPIGLSYPAIVIYEMCEGEECGFDDFRLKRKEVWSSTVGPDVSGKWNELFRSDFRALIESKQKAPSA